MPDGVRGVGLDDDTRCVHYATERDVVAIRFGCCEAYYACFRCHQELADHDAVPWPVDRREEPAVRCGACGTPMSAPAYVSTDTCPECGTAFNPNCERHYGRYFGWLD
jgi:uncharacterized CHY-type Zn-finger protein